MNRITGLHKAFKFRLQKGEGGFQFFPRGRTGMGEHVVRKAG